MKTHSKFIAAILAASVSTVALAQVASAEAPAADAAVEEVVAASAITVSEAGRNAMTGIHYAKMALAQGQTDAAKEILAKVATVFGDDDAALMMKTDAGFGLPLDTALGFAEGFAPSDAHAPAFALADEQMRAGDIDGVFATLTEAGVDVVAQVALLPYAAAVDGLKQAAADLDAGDTVKAAAALDAINASVTVENFAPDALPAQGYAMTDILQG